MRDLTTRCTWAGHRWIWWLEDDVRVRCTRCLRPGKSEDAPPIESRAPATLVDYFRALLGASSVADKPE